LKGHGASPRPVDGNYSLETQAALVYDIIQERGLRNITLMGNSLGGGVALTLAIKMAMERDDRLSGLVLLDSIYKPPVPFMFKVLRTPFWGRLAMSLPAHLTVLSTLWYVTAAHGMISKDVVDAYSANLSAPGGRKALIESVRQIDLKGSEEAIQKVRRLDVRALVIWGRDDPLFGLAIAEHLHQDLRNSRYFVIDKCGHLPQEERPEAVVSHVRDFLLNN
jgi:pimeloyl-ACP methyl ester carboxylesterase